MISTVGSKFLFSGIYTDFLSLVMRLQEIKEDSNGNLTSPVISAVKNLSVCLDVKSKWNPRGNL